MPNYLAFVAKPNRRSLTNFQLNSLTFEASASLQTLLQSLTQKCRKSARLGNNPQTSLLYRWFSIIWVYWVEIRSFLFQLEWCFKLNLWHFRHKLVSFSKNISCIIRSLFCSTWINFNIPLLLKHNLFKNISNWVTFLWQTLIQTIKIALKIGKG